MLNGIDDGEDNEGDFDWSRKEYIGDVDTLDWLAAQAKINLLSPTLGTREACQSRECPCPCPLRWKIFSPVALGMWQI